MALPEFLANEFAPLDFSSIFGYPNRVPSFYEWITYLPRFSGNTEKMPDQHLKVFRECMEQQGIFLEYVQMKLFKCSLDEHARVWYKTIPHGNISSLKFFHVALHQYFKKLYPPNALFENWCTRFNNADLYDVTDLVEDVCGAPLQENIYSHQEASPNE